MYFFESDIRYSEVDSTKTLSWLKLMDYFQDCSTFHSEHLGIGMDFLEARHLAWIVVSWQICVNRLPHLADHVIIRTFPYEVKGMNGLRNFTMETPEGEILAYANSHWVLMDTEKGRPVRAPREIIEGYERDPRFPMHYCSRKLPVPDQYEEADPFTVPSYFIDTNHHMNNSKYFLAAQDVFPDGEEFREVRIEYCREAHLGETLCRRRTEEGDRITVNLSDADGNPYAIVVALREIDHGITEERTEKPC